MASYATGATGAIGFEPPEIGPAAQAMRERVRSFLARERDTGGFVPGNDGWTRIDVDFSRRFGAAGFIGLTLPREFGGGGATSFERFVVVEEVLAAGAPVGAHWVADRQSGPHILRHGSERARRTILPEICAGRCFFSIGMSEPNAGSDLASVATRAAKVDDGWRVTGRKVWTSYAHVASYMIALVRTAPRSEQRHAGLTQLIIDLKAPGVTIRPIPNMAGTQEFNEVTLDDVHVPDDMVIGEVGAGWAMVTSELAFERSGPERFMSTYPLLARALDVLPSDGDALAETEIGRMTARLIALRTMSVSVNSMLDRGANPATQAAMIKDLGATFEQELPHIVRRITPGVGGNAALDAEILDATLRAPSFSLRGGTREILRGIIAKDLGLR